MFIRLDMLDVIRVRELTVAVFCDVMNYTVTSLQICSYCYFVIF